MICLAIHTAGASCDVAILRGDACIGEACQPMKRGHDQALPVLTQTVLKEVGISVTDLDRIAVCTGPGSFTGIRVGVAFARGLALANDLQAVGVTSLEALAAQSGTRPAIAVIPAKQRLPDLTFWVQGFAIDDFPVPEEVGLDQLQSFAEENPGVTFLCEAAKADHARSHLTMVSDWIEVSTGAEAVARYAIALPDGALPTAKPVYAREPDAVPAKKINVSGP